MKIFKKMILSISILFMSLYFVSANQVKFVVQICNVVDLESPNEGQILAYEVDDLGRMSKIIVQKSIPHRYANELIRALNIFLTPDLNGVPIELPLSRATEKGDRIYRILSCPHSDVFEGNLLREFINLKKIRHIFTSDLNSSGSSECSPVSSPRKDSIY